MNRFFCKTIVIGLLALAPIQVFAEKKDALSLKKIVCVDPKIFADQIFNCGENKVAVSYAKNCATALNEKSKLVGNALALEMKAMEKSNQTQKDSEQEARSRIVLAAANLESLIEELQSNTDILEKYTESMIDDPESKSDDDSLDCFNESYHAIQDIITNLDNQIMASKAAHDQATALFKQMTSIDTNLGADKSSNTTVLKNAQDKQNAIPARKGSKTLHKSSSISGEIKEDKNKNK